MTLTHGSLFSGIGGFDLAAAWAGFENKFSCEINPFGQKVLASNFPNEEIYSDILKTDFSKWRGQIDVLSGGFPCQPFSHAGKRGGAEDPRHLWPRMFEVIKEIRPRWVIGENVPGLVSWNEGQVFDEVQKNLESIDYELTLFIIPAAAVNAPHKRDRLWIIARDLNAATKKIEYIEDEKTFLPFKNFPKNYPTYSNFSDEFKAGLNVSFPYWRRETIKAYGNAIVPEIAFKIFSAIKEAEAGDD